MGQHKFDILNYTLDIPNNELEDTLAKFQFLKYDDVQKIDPHTTNYTLSDFVVDYVEEPKPLINQINTSYEEHSGLFDKPQEPLASSYSFFSPFQTYNDPKSQEKIANRYPEHFEVLQNFEGYVVSVDNEEEEVTCIVTETSKENAKSFEVTFDFSQITEDDFELLQPGAVFYWHVGRHRSETGQISNTSEIAFRRLPTWTKSKLTELKSIADSFREAIGETKKQDSKAKANG